MNTRSLLARGGPLDRPAVRYFIVSVGAFVMDIALALTLRAVFGLPVSFAAGIAFVTLAICCYFVHEYWTFAHAEARPQAGRFGRNLVAQGAALALRVAVIAVLEALHRPDQMLAALYILAGAGCSLTLNFVLNRFWVFRGR